MRITLVGAAVLALAASSLHADPGGQGKGGNSGKSPSAAAQGHGNASGKGSGKAPDKGPSNKGSSDKGSNQARGNAPQTQKPAGQNANKKATESPGQARTPQKRAAKVDARSPAKDNRNAAPARVPAKAQNRNESTARQGRNRIITTPRDFRWASLAVPNRLIKGCPPGLAQKRNGCVPPGQAKKNPWHRPGWYGSGWSRGYRYYNGYMLRLGSNNRVLSYIPLLGGALSVGNVWPSAYEPVVLPPYYVDYYGLGPTNRYRYYGDTIYRVDPGTSAIQSIAALLTGQDFIIGDPMPPGYGVYNVPYPYRDRYRDGPDAYYRYSDGYIYQVDPETRLIVAAIELLI